MEDLVSNLRLGQLDLTNWMTWSSVLEGPEGSFLKGMEFTGKFPGQ